MTTRTVCGHGDRSPCQSCGGGWCMKDSGHSGPHTGQDHRCLWGATYEGTRDGYIRTGDLAYLDAMLELVTL